MEWHTHIAFIKNSNTPISKDKNIQAVNLAQVYGKWNEAPERNKKTWLQTVELSQISAQLVWH